MTDFGVPPSSFPPPVPPLPPTGVRTGPPWEQPGPAVQRYIDTAKGALLDPVATFRNARRDGGLGPPLTFYLIGALVSVLAQAVWSGIGLSPYGGFGGGPYAGGGLISSILVGAVAVLVGLFIGSGLIHLVLMLLGGAKFGFEATLRTIAYAQGSAMPIGVIPFCGSLIAAVWAIVVTIMGLAEMQEVSVGKAAAAVLIPAIVCCLLISVAFGAAIVAMMGLAAAAQN